VSENKQEKNNKPVVSQRFVTEVRRQFAEEMGESLEFSDYEKKLAQHMFLKVDEALKSFEDGRKGSKTPYTWENVNIKSLALDAVYKVSLGLDALMKNHVHPIPYFNGKNGKYDIDLQTGYKGLIYKAKKFAIDPPKDIVVELVHENDHFKPLKSNFDREVESYEFEIENPFDRGKVTGGFGYIMYDDQTKNQLILVSKKQLDKAKNQAPTQKIWNKWPEKMQLKTVVRRTIDHIDLDPEKTNAKALIHEETGSVENEARREIEENANQEFVDIDFKETVEDNEENQNEEQPENEQKEEEKQPAMASAGTEGPEF